jgi:hypothetical protein
MDQTALPHSMTEYTTADDVKKVVSVWVPRSSTERDCQVGPIGSAGRDKGWAGVSTGKNVGATIPTNGGSRIASVL